MFTDISSEHLSPNSNMLVLPRLFLFFVIVTNDSVTVPLTISVPELQPLRSVNSEEKNRWENEEQSIKLRESDQSFLKTIALFIVVFLVFTLIVCICAMYWCICWSLHCPGTAVVRSMIRGTRESSAILRLTRYCSGGKSKRRNPDPPPPYEMILTTCAVEDEIPPPTYAEALMSSTGAT